MSWSGVVRFRRSGLAPIIKAASGALEVVEQGMDKRRATIRGGRHLERDTISIVHGASYNQASRPSQRLLSKQNPPRHSLHHLDVGLCKESIGSFERRDIAHDDTEI